MIQEDIQQQQLNEQKSQDQLDFTFEGKFKRVISCPILNLTAGIVHDEYNNDLYWGTSDGFLYIFRSNKLEKIKQEQQNGNKQEEMSEQLIVNQNQKEQIDNLNSRLEFLNIKQDNDSLKKEKQKKHNANILDQDLIVDSQIQRNQNIKSKNLLMENGSLNFNGVQIQKEKIDKQNQLKRFSKWSQKEKDKQQLQLENNNQGDQNKQNSNQQSINKQNEDQILQKGQVSIQNVQLSSENDKQDQFQNNLQYSNVLNSTQNSKSGQNDFDTQNDNLQQIEQNLNGEMHFKLSNKHTVQEQNEEQNNQLNKIDSIELISNNNQKNSLNQIQSLSQNMQISEKNVNIYSASSINLLQLTQQFKNNSSQKQRYQNSYLSQQNGKQKSNLENQDQWLDQCCDKIKLSDKQIFDIVVLKNVVCLSFFTNFVTVLSKKTFQKVYQLRGDLLVYQGISFLCKSNDDEVIIRQDNPNGIEVWKINCFNKPQPNIKKLFQTSDSYEDQFYAMQVIQKQLMVYGNNQGTINIINLKSGKIVENQNKIFKSQIISLSTNKKSQIGQQILVGADSKWNFKIFSLPYIQTITQFNVFNLGFMMPSFHQQLNILKVLNSDTILISGSSKEAVIYDWKESKTKKNISYQNSNFISYINLSKQSSIILIKQVNQQKASFLLTEWN